GFFVGVDPATPRMVGGRLVWCLRRSGLGDDPWRVRLLRALRQCGDGQILSAKSHTDGTVKPFLDDDLIALSDGHGLFGGDLMPLILEAHREVVPDAACLLS